MILKAQAIKAKIDKLDFMKIKNLKSSKDTVNIVKVNLQIRRKYFKTTNQ